MCFSFLSNTAAWEPQQSYTVLREARLQDDPTDYRLHEGMWQTKLTLKIWSRTAGSYRVSRRLGSRTKRLHLQNYLLYSGVINKHVRASTFQNEVYSSYTSSEIIIKIIVCVSNKSANLGEKMSRKHEIIIYLASHRPCEIVILICTLQRRKHWHEEIVICSG